MLYFLELPNELPAPSSPMAAIAEVKQHERVKLNMVLQFKELGTGFNLHIFITNTYKYLQLISNSYANITLTHRLSTS